MARFSRYRKYNRTCSAAAHCFLLLSVKLTERFSEFTLLIYLQLPNAAVLSSKSTFPSTQTNTHTKTIIPINSTSVALNPNNSIPASFFSTPRKWTGSSPVYLHSTILRTLRFPSIVARNYTLTLDPPRLYRHNISTTYIYT